MSVLWNPFEPSPPLRGPPLLWRGIFLVPPQAGTFRPPPFCRRARINALTAIVPRTPARSFRICPTSRRATSDVRVFSSGSVRILGARLCVRFVRTTQRFVPTPLWPPLGAGVGRVYVRRFPAPTIHQLDATDPKRPARKAELSWTLRPQ